MTVTCVEPLHVEVCNVKKQSNLAFESLWQNITAKDNNMDCHNMDCHTSLPVAVNDLCYAYGCEPQNYLAAYTDYQDFDMLPSFGGIGLDEARGQEIMGTRESGYMDSKFAARTDSFSSVASSTETLYDYGMPAERVDNTTTDDSINNIEINDITIINNNNNYIKKNKMDKGHGKTKKSKRQSESETTKCPEVNSGSSSQASTSSTEDEKVVRYPCPFHYTGCTYSTKRKRNLKQHISHVHARNVQWFHCPHVGCTYRAKRKDTLKCHLNSRIHINDEIDLKNMVITTSTGEREPSKNRGKRNKVFIINDISEISSDMTTLIGPVQIDVKKDVKKEVKLQLEVKQQATQYNMRDNTNAVACA